MVKIRQLATVLALCAAILPGTTTIVAGQDSSLSQPRLWDSSEQIDRVDVTPIQRLRFLTVLDEPPFAFTDEYGKLTGLYVDLVREICAELKLTDRCQVQALPYDELIAALQRGEGDAVIAGIPANAENRKTLLFTRPYLLPAARLVVRRPSSLTDSGDKRPQKVGILDGSAHEVLLRRDMSDLEPIAYTNEEWMLEDLKAGRIDAVLGDAARYSVWLAGTGAAGCCMFGSGPYLAPGLLGPGLTIAVSGESQILADALNFALYGISGDRRFEDILLRYFPLGIY